MNIYIYILDCPITDGDDMCVIHTGSRHILHMIYDRGDAAVTAAAPTVITADPRVHLRTPALSLLTSFTMPLRQKNTLKTTARDERCYDFDYDLIGEQFPNYGRVRYLLNSGNRYRAYLEGSLNALVFGVGSLRMA